MEIGEGREAFEFFLLYLDEIYPEERGMALSALWASTGILPDEILLKLENKEFPKILPDFEDRDNRPRLLLSTIARVMGIEQRLLEDHAVVGSDKFRCAADFLYLTRRKYEDDIGAVGKLYRHAWEDFYTEAPEEIRESLDQKFKESFGDVLSKMTPCGFDAEHGNIYSISEVAAALGISEEEAMNRAEEMALDGGRSVFSIDVKIPDDEKEQ